MTSPVRVVSEQHRGRRARWSLTGVVAGLTAIAALLILAARLLAPAPPTPATIPEAPGPATHPADGWDWPGEAALARAPMPLLAPAAAQPQALAAHPNPEMLTLPVARSIVGPLAYGLPGTGPGAIAALTVLDETALRGGDPHTYATAYDAVSTPGAPAATGTRLFGLLTEIRDRGGLPASGPVDGLTVTYQVMQAQLKGLRDGGRYAVVCVLGELAIDYHGRLLTNGVSDCQALRYLPTTEGGGQWRISPGPAAARAADAWPGSDDSVRTGYLEVSK